MYTKNDVAEIQHCSLHRLLNGPVISILFSIFSKNIQIPSELSRNNRRSPSGPQILRATSEYLKNPWRDWRFWEQSNCREFEKIEDGKGNKTRRDAKILDDILILRFRFLYTLPPPIMVDFENIVCRIFWRGWEMFLRFEWGISKFRTNRVRIKCQGCTTEHKIGTFVSEISDFGWFRTIFELWLARTRSVVGAL